MLEVILLIVAGGAAGVLNAVAGGGTFLTLPALVFIGLPPVSANATTTLTALPGYAASAWAFRADIRSEGALGLAAMSAIAALGSGAGAFLLIVTPEDTFRGVVPWLLLAATLLFAAGPSLVAALRRRGHAAPGRALSTGILFAVAVYGGYFNGGLGIMLLAAFGLLGYDDLHGMNGLKNALAVLLSLIAVATFVMAGLIAWTPAVAMAGAATLGGYLGGRFSRRIRDVRLLRGFITLVGLAMSAAFFLS